MNVRLRHPLPICLFLLILVGFLPYAGTLSYSFHYDDFGNIVDNPRIQDLRVAVGDLCSLRSRSLSFLTFAANYRFGEYSVAGYHLVNIGFHILNGLMAFILFGRIAALLSLEKETAAWVPFYASLLFLTHPVHTISVTFIVQRAGEMAAFFTLASLFLFLSAETARTGVRKVVNYILVFLGFLCAVLSKQDAVSIPILAVLLYALLFVKTREDLVGLGVRACAAVLVVLITSHFLIGLGTIQTGMMFPEIHWSPLVNGITQTNVMMLYFKILLLPLPSFLNVDHPFLVVESFFNWKTAGSFAVLLGLAVLGAGRFRKSPVVSLGIFWFFIAIAPSSSIVALPDPVMEYRLYLPSMGFHLLLVWLVWKGTGAFFPEKTPVFRKIKPYAGHGLLILLAVFSGILTFERNRVYENDYTFWSDAAKKSPLKPRPQSNLGAYFLEQGEYMKAEVYFDKAKKLEPHIGIYQRNLGMAYLNLGRLSEAVAELTEAINLIPDDPQTRLNLARAYLDLGEVDKSEEILKSSGPFEKPLYTVVLHKYRAEVFFRTGRFSESLAELEIVRKLEPTDVDVPLNRGEIFLSRNQPDRAVEEFRKAIVLHPEQGRAYARLGYLAESAGNMEDAKRYYRQSLEKKLDPDDRKWIRERLHEIESKR